MNQFFRRFTNYSRCFKIVGALSTVSAAISFEPILNDPKFRIKNDYRIINKNVQSNQSENS